VIRAFVVNKSGLATGLAAPDREVFDKRGHHAFVADAVTGGTLKPKRKGRRIRV